MVNFSGTTTDISLKNHHTWRCPVYVLDAIFKGNISGLTKWEPCSRAGIYIGHPPFHSRPVALVLNPATGNFSPQFHVWFDDEFSTVPFVREDTIPPNWTDLVQRRSQSGAQDNIDLKDTCFTPDLEEYPIKTPNHVPIVTLEIPVVEGASVSEAIKRPVSERVQNTSNLPNFVLLNNLPACLVG